MGNILIAWLWGNFFDGIKSHSTKYQKCKSRGLFQMSKLRQELIKKLERIPGLEDRPSKVAGGSAIFYNDKEIAHFHNDNEIDVRLTRKFIRRDSRNLKMWMKL